MAGNGEHNGDNGQAIAPIPRAANGRFLPGKPGGPGRGPNLETKLREKWLSVLADGATPERLKTLFDRLFKIATEGSDRDSVPAIRVLLERISGPVIDGEEQQLRRQFAELMALRRAKTRFVEVTTTTTTAIEVDNERDILDAPPSGSSPDTTTAIEVDNERDGELLSQGY
jgi:hypothetical protein